MMLKATGALATVAAFVAWQGLAVTNARAEELYPQIADISHTTPETAAFFESYFTAKSLHDPAGDIAHFSPELVTYTDATLGWDIGNYDNVKRFLYSYMPKWPPGGKSYPTEILGGPQSALVAFLDSPELFGGELRILASVDRKNGKIVRWVDYWDSRSLDRAVDSQLRQPPGKFVTDLKEREVGETASPKMQAVAGQMQKAFAAGDAKAAADIVSSDATYEDMTLRTRLRGRAAIERYFARVLAAVPFGSGSTLRHVVGSDQGGGFEWIGAGELSGITALRLDAEGKVTSITTVYDGRLLNEAALKSLVVLSLDP